MPKVTRKLQITVPKRLAEQVGIGPGSEVEFSVAGDAIRMAPVGKQAQAELSTVTTLPRGIGAPGGEGCRLRSQQFGCRRAARRSRLDPRRPLHPALNPRPWSG
jgi:AbrB family looped-hinge helix DNA binding protein